MTPRMHASIKTSQNIHGRFYVIVPQFFSRATHNLFMLVNGQLKTTTVIENTERQLEKVSESCGKSCSVYRRGHWTTTFRISFSK